MFFKNTTKAERLDLKKIRQKIENDEYTSPWGFVEDVWRMLRLLTNNLAKNSSYFSAASKVRQLILIIHRDISKCQVLTVMKNEYFTSTTSPNPDHQ